MVFATKKKRLFKLVEEENFDEVKLFLQKHKINLDVKRKNRTALCVAVWNGDVRMVKLLLQHGANPNKGGDWLSPLMFARSAPVIEVLIEAGADINSRDFVGRTALAHVLQHSVEGVKVLSDNGADLNTKDRDGFTPLHIAVRWGRVKSAFFLASAGANLSLQDKKGNTALHSAIYHNKAKIARFLIDAGADTEVVNLEGKRAFDIAHMSGKKELIDVFEVDAEKPTESGYHAVNDYIVTQVVGKCPVNGVLTETFNFKVRTVMESSDRAMAPAVSFDDYVSVAEGGQKIIEDAFAWLCANSNEEIKPPFKKPKPILLKKK